MIKADKKLKVLIPLEFLTGFELLKLIISNDGKLRGSLGSISKAIGWGYKPQLAKHYLERYIDLGILRKTGKRCWELTAKFKKRMVQA